MFAHFTMSGRAFAHFTMSGRAFAIVLLGACAASAQLLSLTVCSDNTCSAGCASWLASSGWCVDCQHAGGCSYSNPASIATLGGITFYSDSRCNNQVTSTQPMTFDGNCHLLGPGGLYGSYTALDVSAIIGGVLGGVLLIVLIVVLCCLCATPRRAPCCVCGQTVGHVEHPAPEPPKPVVVVYGQQQPTVYA